MAARRRVTAGTHRVHSMPLQGDESMTKSLHSIGLDATDRAGEGGSRGRGTNGSAGKGAGGRGQEGFSAPAPASSIYV